MSYYSKLLPEDYLEPECPLCGNPFSPVQNVKPIPQQRILSKLEEYLSRRDYNGAERLLLYWMDEAKLGNDLRGQLFLSNELIGHYRKVHQAEKALQYIDVALNLIDVLDFGNTISAGTTYVNAATACIAFGENERALALFEKARAIYESSPQIQAHLLGGLYNNMASAYQALGHYREAHDLYDKAMNQMESVPGGVLEQAITCLNIADVVAAESGIEQGEEQIFSLLDQACILLHDDTVPRDGYYAFVCEKCAPCFDYYGYFAVAEELRAEAKEIYERS